MEKSIIMYNTRLTGEITSISYSLLHGIGVGLKGFAFNLYFIRPEELHFGGKNWESWKILEIGLFALVRGPPKNYHFWKRQGQKKSEHDAHSMLTKRQAYR